jgi:inner membrane protein
MLAKAELRRATEAAFPALTVLDIAMTPMPANPRCWEALVAGRQNESYRVIRASVAILSLDASACGAGDDIVPTAPVERLERPTRGGVRFRSEYRAPIAELRQLRRDDCRFRALLKFARLPYVTPVRASRYGAAGRYAGDLRYDRERDSDFSDLQLPRDPRTGACPRFVPGWVEPRAELFQP